MNTRNWYRSWHNAVFIWNEMQLKLFTAWSMSNKISFRQTSWYCVCWRDSISSVFISSQTHYECDIVDNSSITPSRSIYHVILYQIMSLNKAAMTPDSYAIRSYLFLVNPLGPFCHAYCQRQPHWKQQHNHINDIWIQWLWEQSQLQCSYVFLLKVPSFIARWPVAFYTFIFTLYSLTDTFSGTPSQLLISTTVYSQVLIHRAEWTGAMLSERTCSVFYAIAKGFEPVSLYCDSNAPALCNMFHINE